MYKTFDTWLNVSRGTSATMKEATDLLIAIEAHFADRYLLNKVERLGCAYRVQLQMTEQTAAEMAEKLEREFEPAREY